MTDSIRAKQAREVLDVWQDVSRQVTALTRKQVATFPQSLKPKTQRDLGVEVNVDKSVEGLSKTLDAKLAALEYFVQNLSTAPVRGLAGLTESGAMLTPVAQAYAAAISTGDVIPLWNGIARLYQTPGLSRQSQETVKVALQQLVPSLDALKFGYRSAIDFTFQKPALITAPARVRPARAKQPEPSTEELEALKRRPGPARAADQDNPFDLPEQKAGEFAALLPGRGELEQGAVRAEPEEEEVKHEDPEGRGRGGVRPRGAAPRAAPRGRAAVPRGALRVSSADSGSDSGGDSSDGAARARRVRAAPSVNAQLSLKVLELLRALSVYSLVRTQVDAEPRPISVQDLDAAYKNIFQSLTQQEIDYLKEEAPRGAILPRTLRNIPDFDTPDTAQRLKAIQEELGIRFPPEYYAELRKLPRDKLNAALDQARLGVRASVSKSEQDQLRAVRSTWAQHLQATQILTNKLIEAQAIAEFTRDEESEAGFRQFEPFGPPKIVPLLEEVLEPEPFEYDPRYSFEENAERFETWQAVSDSVAEVQAENERIRMDNFLEQAAYEANDEAGRREFLDSLANRLEILRREVEQTQQQAEAAEDGAEAALDALREGQASKSDNTLRELRLYLGAVAQRPVAETVERFLAAKPREGFGKPRGRSIDTRGLASLRYNYGAADSDSCSSSGSESDSDEEDALDFDDTRNEHYSTRPLRA